MAHVATQRTPEIGIRLAIGAPPASIVTLLLGQGLRLLGIGVAIGLTGALLGTRYIEAQLFGVTATDPLTFVSGCVVLAIAGLTASLIRPPRDARRSGHRASEDVGHRRLGTTGVAQDRRALSSSPRLMR